MRRRARGMPEVFGMSLMDTVCCGIGASILMMLVFVSMVEPSSAVTSECVNCKVQSIDPDKQKPIFTLVVDVVGVERKTKLNWQAVSVETIYQPYISIKEADGNISPEQPEVKSKLARKIISQRFLAQFRAPKLDTPLPDELIFKLDFKQADLEKVKVYARVITEVRGDICELSAEQVTEFRFERKSNTYVLDCKDN